ncbi:nicotinamide N-methyltransferase-like [Haliotis rufescens]|uniref:nicotinamide N-methyltransferase-like n=1 Tax=Haliotis rufescens TaxID=6454 RepID=UPI00201EC42B|nr:nicotinamide N-methyltransferase-like [Haliotis rufescens]
MADKEMAFCDDYAKDFDPEYYMQVFEDPEPSPILANLMSFILTNYHKAFNSGAVKGKTLLDIGTGPTIYSVISSAQHCDNIFLSDFCQSNNDILKQWRDGSLEFSFDKIFEMVLKIEGKSKTDVPERAVSIRDKICGILHCDIREENPFSPNFLPQVDIVTSSFCLEAVATDVASYERYARNMVGMLKPGGHLVICGCLGGTFYIVGVKKFSTLGMSRDELKSTWKKVGIQIISWDEGLRLKEDYSDVEGSYCMVGKKVPVAL